ncbi:hypothetical protein [Micromonospora eburnea]|nr:hypothetical protein [Micromonospora eburnea]
MALIRSVILDGPDFTAEAFYGVVGVGPHVRVRASDAPAAGFRSFVLSLVASRPKVATSAKKDTDPATRQIDDIVPLRGVADVKASKQFYVDRGLAVAKSFGSRYVESATPESSVTLALYGRRAAAKDAGAYPDGTGSHRIVIGSDAGPFTDPDGFAWEA